MRMARMVVVGTLVAFAALALLGGCKKSGAAAEGKSSVPDKSSKLEKVKMAQPKGPGLPGGGTK